MKKTILFDLDGTLLPMDQDAFVKYYMGLLARKMAQHGYEPQKLVETVWKGVGAMVHNSGEEKNEQVFWDCFAGTFGEQSRQDLPIFQSFYENEFQQAKAATGYNPAARQTVDWLRESGYELVLATNPIFPQVATYSRLRWAGFQPEDFSLITTYENSTSCKPNLAYYREILQKIDRAPKECLMVGNDTAEDLCVRELGMDAFLLTDCLINKQGQDLSAVPKGGFDDLKTYVQQMPA
jgi:FMN phosphatase YigB (HAD superfamily)